MLNVLSQVPFNVITKVYLIQGPLLLSLVRVGSRPKRIYRFRDNFFIRESGPSGIWTEYVHTII